MKRVYIAAPYSSGDPWQNTCNAIFAAELVSKSGFAPYIPHLSHFWDHLIPHPYQFWIDLDNAFLPICDAVYRLPGASPGADAEVKLAVKLGIPVFLTLEELVRGMG